MICTQIDWSENMQTGKNGEGRQVDRLRTLGSARNEKIHKVGYIMCFNHIRKVILLNSF